MACCCPSLRMCTASLNHLVNRSGSVDHCQLLEVRPSNAVPIQSAARPGSTPSPTTTDGELTETQPMKECLLISAAVHSSDNDQDQSGLHFRPALGLIAALLSDVSDWPLTTDHYQ